MNQKMIGHQLFYAKTKISEKVLTPFWRSLQCLLLPALESKNGGLLSINTIYVGTKINVLQAIENQLTIHNLQNWFDFLKTDFTLKSRVVNKYQFTACEWADSEDYSLFLPPSPPLNRKRYRLFSLPTSKEVGNYCIYTHQEISN